MDPVLLLTGIVIIIAIIAISLVVSSRKSGSKRGGKQKNRSQIIKEASRKLAQDPHNPDGLIALGNVYFNEHNWEKAYQIYDTMLNIAPAHQEIDPFTAALRQGICALKLNKIQDAFRGLLLHIRLTRQTLTLTTIWDLPAIRTKSMTRQFHVSKRPWLQIRKQQT